MRICMLTSFFLPTIGGVENHVYHISKELQMLGHEITVVHTCYDISSKDGVVVENVEGIETHRLYLGLSGTKIKIYGAPVASTYVNGFLRKCRPIKKSKFIADYILKLNRKKNFSLLHQHDFISNIFTTKKLHKYFPIVITNHTGEYLLFARYFFTRPLLSVLLRHIDALIGPSKELAEVEVLQRKKRSFYIANGCDINEFVPLDQESKNEYKAKLGLPLERKLILCARRWAPTKGVIYFVKAIKEIVKECPKAYFLISGNDYFGYPEYRNMIMNIIDADKLHPYIKLLGDIPHEHMAAYDQVADVVVLPSLMEATSLSGLEAMSCGTPIVGTKVGGIPEIIEDGVSGILVPPRDSKKIAQAVISLINDSKKMTVLGKNARQKVIKEFAWRKVAQKTVGVYEEILQ